MVSFKGYCERCGNYYSYLRKVEGFWLCRRCREERGKFTKPKIPFRIIINPMTLSKMERGRIISRRKNVDTVDNL